MSYTATVTKDTVSVERISRNYGFIVGKCDINPYHTTGAEITDITRYFDDTTVAIRVLNDGLSDNGFCVRWSTVDKCFHAYYGDYDAEADGALIEAVDDADVGEVNFIAFGIIR